MLAGFSSRSVELDLLREELASSRAACAKTRKDSRYVRAEFRWALHELGNTRTKVATTLARARAERVVDGA